VAPDHTVLKDSRLRVLATADVIVLLTGARHPSRDPDTNIADLRAQIAANEKGIERLLQHGDGTTPAPPRAGCCA
ncbi:hypothetical protein ABZT27_35730, partial [Streptomyces sp. NPDC005389]|uniref:hypothetical protein n=1 Tax=Streptomyces sp. NPDC005389 TaxID=3157040 RepID=UPI0033AA9038